MIASGWDRWESLRHTRIKLEREYIRVRLVTIANTDAVGGRYAIIDGLTTVVRSADGWAKAW